MPVATTSDFNLEWFGSFFILFFFIAVGVILSITQKLSLKLIRRSFDINNTTLGGYGVDHWVKQLLVPSEISFDQTQNNVIEFCGHAYFFVHYSSLPITFGACGYTRVPTEIKYWCLIAVGEAEVEIIEQKPKLFRRLSKYNPILGAYIIRSLPDFARMVKRSSKQIA